MDRPEDWTSDSNEVVKLHIDKRLPDSIVTLAPAYTYAIFGNVEKIFGFKDLKIDITFCATTLLTLLEINWTEKIDESLNVETEDLDALVSSYLPEDIFRDRQKWNSACDEQTRSFKPPGDQVSSYDIKGKSYVVHRSSLANEQCSKFLDRMQIFSIMYIEGASLIDSTDDRFDVYTIYATSGDHFEFVGYCTCYKYFFYDRLNRSFDHIRYRISQFVILPNHQSSGHGGHLFDAITSVCLLDDKILEIVVEDPSEAFDDLRDRRDLLRVGSDNQFVEVATTLSTDEGRLIELRRRLKLAPRQFHRLLEMNRLKHEASWTRQQRQIYRRSVKERLFKKNKDILAELGPAERLEKLEETYNTQITDYKRLLKGLLQNGHVTCSPTGTVQGTRRTLADSGEDLMDSAMRKKARPS